MSMVGGVHGVRYLVCIQKLVVQRVSVYDSMNRTNSIDYKLTRIIDTTFVLFFY